MRRIIQFSIVNTLISLFYILNHSYIYAQAPKKIPTKLRPLIPYIYSIDSTTPNSPNTDLQRLDSLFLNKQLIAMGEATHGTKEFFQLKHRFFQYLVEKHNVTVFAIEANFTEALVLNDYILTGKGNPTQLIGRMYFWTWYTKEFLALVEWMRNYNADPAHTNKIKFYGFDIQFTKGATEAITTYLKKTNDTLADLFQKISPTLLQLEFGNAYAAQTLNHRQFLQSSIESLIKYFETNCTRFEQLTNKNEYQITLQQIKNLHYAILTQKMNLKSLKFSRKQKMNRTELSGYVIRDSCMAQNVKWIYEFEGKSKIFLWAHNGHVAKAPMAYRPMGEFLDKQYDSTYCSIGFDFNQGGFQAKEPIGEDYQLKTFNVKPRKESLAFQLLKINYPISLLNLSAMKPADYQLKWLLNDVQTIRSIGALFYPESEGYFLADLKNLNQLFDALIFIDKTTPTVPIDDNLKTHY